MVFDIKIIAYIQVKQFSGNESSNGPSLHPQGCLPDQDERTVTCHSPS